MRQVYVAGNSVASYYYDTEVCSKCCGEGEVDADKEGLRNFLDDSHLPLNEKKDIVRRWRKYGVIPCPDCNGRGRWERRW